MGNVSLCYSITAAPSSSRPLVPDRSLEHSLGRAGPRIPPKVRSRFGPPAAAGDAGAGGGPGGLGGEVVSWGRINSWDVMLLGEAAVLRGRFFGGFENFDYSDV